MNLQYGGRPVAWLGLGAPADDVASGIAALQAALAQASGGGITNFGGAVANLQTAGTAAAMNLGPAIDALSGADPDVKKITGYCWTQNQKLSGVNSSSTAAQADVDSAKSIVQDMITNYQQAQRLAASKAPAASGGAPKPSGSSPGSSPAKAPPSGGSAPKTPDAAAPADDGSFTAWVKKNQTPLAVGGAVLAGGAILAAVLSASAPKRAT